MSEKGLEEGGRDRHAAQDRRQHSRRRGVRGGR